MYQVNDAINFDFCTEFMRADSKSRFILGKNVYSKSLIEKFEIEAVVDDYSTELTFCGVPVIKSADLPCDALVVNASGGKPFTAKKVLDNLGVRSLDYFSFLRITKLNLCDVVFNEGFQEEYAENQSEYSWIRSKLSDDKSRIIFDKLVGFRSSLDISYLEGFVSAEHEQYFEGFLALQPENEVFVDIGCFNGSNSIEFSKISPRYHAIYAFEPDPENFKKCKKSLQNLRDVYLENVALSDTKGTMRLTPGGSASKISPNGTIDVAVNRLDDLTLKNPTLIKMDIEGAEIQALKGASATISGSHPRLAICVYHNVGDFHRIPRVVLGIRDDYDIYLRHYTETIYETVMFFVPRN